MSLGYLKKLAKYVGAKGAGFILPHVSRHPELLGKLINKLLELGISNVRKKGNFPPEEMERKVDAIKMIGEMIKRTLPTLAPNVQRTMVYNLLYHPLTHGEAAREAYYAKHGEWPPTFLAISPSMRCDLRCEGCYASEYKKYGELTKAEFIKTVKESRDVFGAHFCTVLGGEPTCWPHIWECAEELNDVFFQVYTHGQSITPELAERVAGLGNVALAISIEGDKQCTDERRGEGVYDKIMKSIEIIRDAGILFGFSTTHTTKNHEVLKSDKFYKSMYDLGAAFGWVFQYAPMGRNPDMSQVVTPTERLERFAQIESFRRKYPLALFDFWNDGEMTDGCMAYGRRYIHVQSSGDVEPCVFVHFKAGNIRTNTLEEILLSPFLKDARSQMPFYGDRRAPCSFLDNPNFIREMVCKYNLEPTHDGAESIVSNLHSGLLERAEEYKKLLALDRPERAEPLKKKNE